MFLSYKIRQTGNFYGMNYDLRILIENYFFSHSKSKQIKIKYSYTVGTLLSPQ